MAKKATTTPAPKKGTAEYALSVVKPDKKLSGFVPLTDHESLEMLSTPKRGTAK